MRRILASTWFPPVLVASVAALPRLVVLAFERGTILTEFTEKSDDFAQVLVESGTFGFVPGVPSAYTQPLYGWFLAVLYWLVDRHWLVVGLAQVAVAVAVALLVWETGRRFLSPRVGVIAAVVATLQPYLIWHDVHVNREILDQLAGVAVFFLTLLLAQRRSWPVALALGATLGIAILGNARLAALPLVVAGYLLWRRVGIAPLALALAALVVTLAPWVARNRVEVGCWAVTTDSRALWKANNVNTFATLRGGGWIDDVPPLPGAPRLTPEFTRDIYLDTGEIVRVDECAQMRLYREATFDFWREHPGEKAKLMAQATWMLWDPRTTRTEGGPSASGNERLRSWGEALYAIPLFALALAGLWAVPLRFAVLAVAFAGYATFAAWLFAGATRYRVSWDFVLALLAAAALDRILSRRVATAS